MSTTTRYRDRASGRFVKKATWARSKARGGSKYVRERVRAKPRKQRAPAPALAPTPAPVQEYQVDVKYKAKKNDMQISINVRGPLGMTKEQVVAAIEKRIETGKAPEGFEISLTEWRKAQQTYKGDSKAFDQFGFNTLFRGSSKDLRQ